MSEVHRNFARVRPCKNPGSKRVSFLTAQRRSHLSQQDLELLSRIRAPCTLQHLTSHTNRETANTGKHIFQLLVFNNSGNLLWVYFLINVYLLSLFWSQVLLYHHRGSSVILLWHLWKLLFSQKRDACHKYLAKGYCLKAWMVLLLVTMKLNSKCKHNCGLWPEHATAQ